MFFLLLIVLLVLFQSKSGNTIPVGELWFMLSVFVGLAYVAGFLDSRLFARFDKKNASRLLDAERHYENTFGESPFPREHQPELN